MTVKLLTEHHMEFLSLKRGCTGLSESILVKIPQCWKSHVGAHISITTAAVFYNMECSGSMDKGLDWGSKVY